MLGLRLSQESDVLKFKSSENDCIIRIFLRGFLISNRQLHCG